MAVAAAAFVGFASSTNPHQARIVAPHASRPGSPPMVQPMIFPESVRALSKSGHSSVSQLSTVIGCVFLTFASAYGRRSRSSRPRERSNALANELPKHRCLEASFFAGAGALHQTRMCKMAMHASLFSSQSVHEDFEDASKNNQLDGDEDVADLFFRKLPNVRRDRPIVPGWRATSPTKLNFNEDVVYFFPRYNSRDPDKNGLLKPNLYKNKNRTKREKKKYILGRKHSWANTSKKLQQEWRYRRVPRDDSGNIIRGKWGAKNAAPYDRQGPTHLLKSNSRPVA